MKHLKKLGVTDQTVLVFIQDSSSPTGAGLTGVTHTMLTARYVRVETDNDVTVTTITMAALTLITDAHADGGWIAVDATNCKGLYRFDIPDGAFASGAWTTVITLQDAGSNNIAQVAMEIDLVAYNPLDAVRLGLSAMPNADAGGSGGLVISVSASSGLSIGASGEVFADVIAISGDATAANNLESDYDGTGYNKSASTVGTVTNLTNAPTSGDLTATMKASVNAEVDTALVDINLDHLVKIAVDTNFATTVHLDSVIGQMADNGTTATFDRTTDSLEALQATIPAAAPTAAEVADAVWDEASADHVAAGSTGERVERLDIITSGGSGGLTNARAVLLDNLDAAVSTRSTVTTAQVNSEVDTALADVRLDELLAADSDIDGAAPPTVGSVFHELMSKTAGSFTFDQTTDSLEAIRDKEADIETDTQDIQTKVGSPAGASVSADIAAVKVDTAAILVDTGTTLDAALAVVDANVDSILADTGTDGVVVAAASKTGYELSATGNNAVADATLIRDVANTEATAALQSLTSTVLKTAGRVAISGSNLITYRTNGTTTHMTQAITEDASQDPISQLGDPS